VTAREHRRRRIRELIATYEIDAQSELVTLLAAEGIDVTQATVSRDLDAMGVGKQRGADGRIAYALPETGSLAQVLRQFVTDVDASGNLAVVRTPPGAAAAVASAIDAHCLPGALATVQGDDTLLVVAVEGGSGRELADALLRIKQARPPSPSDHTLSTTVPTKKDPP
jgi:transcriptional regulator of arginine metabolism